MNSKNKTESKNPHPCAECGIGDDHGRSLYRLRAARMGVGSFLRAGLARIGFSLMSALPQCYRFTQPQTVPDSPEIDDDNEPDVLTLELSGTLTRKQYRRKLWLRLPHCRFCGKKIKPYGEATLDHLQPQAQGGGDQLWNLVLCCQQCNGVKANRTVEEWASDILDGAEPIIHQQ